MRREIIVSVFSILTAGLACAHPPNPRRANPTASGWKALPIPTP